MIARLILCLAVCSFITVSSYDTPKYYTVNMSQTLENIKTEDFGSERSNNYLKDDFIKVLRGTVMRSIPTELFVECNKDLRTKRALAGGGRGVGDCDPAT